jgi:GNAT superfamily N-acetyltransferase
LLAYAEKEPVAWCSVAPKKTYAALGGDDELKNVWSLVCFFIRREFRKTGMVKKLIAEAKKYARKKGAKYLEAYPVDPNSPSYRFGGFISSFEHAGFMETGKAGSRRHVMLYKL